MTKHFTAILIWLLLPMVVLAFPPDIPGITGLAILLFPVAGLILAVIFAILLLRGKHKRNTAIGLALVLIFGTVWFGSGLKWGARIHLLVNRGRYEATIGRSELRFAAMIASCYLTSRFA